MLIKYENKPNELNNFDFFHLDYIHKSFKQLKLILLSLQKIKHNFGLCISIVNDKLNPHTLSKVLSQFLPNLFFLTSLQFKVTFFFSFEDYQTIWNSLLPSAKFVLNFRLSSLHKILDVTIPREVSKFIELEMNLPWIYPFNSYELPYKNFNSLAEFLNSLNIEKIIFIVEEERWSNTYMECRSSEPHELTQFFSDFFEKFTKYSLLKSYCFSSRACFCTPPQPGFSALVPHDFSKFINLEELKLQINFHCCEHEHRLDRFAESLSNVPKLRILKLRFDSNPFAEIFIKYLKNFKKLKVLEVFNIDQRIVDCQELFPLKNRLISLELGGDVFDYKTNEETMINFKYLNMFKIYETLYVSDSSMDEQQKIECKSVTKRSQLLKIAYVLKQTLHKPTFFKRARIINEILEHFVES